MELKVVIIGMGIMGTQVAHAIGRNRQAKLVAVSELREDRLDSAKTEFGCMRGYTRYEEMLDAEKPDAAFVATPDWAHFDPVMACCSPWPVTGKERLRRPSLRRPVEKGLPVYAECGGSVFLGEELIYEQQHYRMAGVLPAVFAFQKRLQGHGYVEIENVQPNPFYRAGETVRGHEFHYTYLESLAADDLTFAFRVHRGNRFDGRRDGLCAHNVLAFYILVHALGPSVGCRRWCKRQSDSSRARDIICRRNQPGFLTSFHSAKWRAVGVSPPKLQEPR